MGSEAVRLDVVAAGAVNGRVTVAFETKQPPPRKTDVGAGPWCSFESLSARAGDRGAPQAQEECSAQPCGNISARDADHAGGWQHNGCASARHPEPPPPPPVRLSQPRF